MTKMDLLIKALEALPEERRNELADAFAALATIEVDHPGSFLTDEQWEEIERRRDNFQPADPERLKQIMAKFS